MSITQAEEALKRALCFVGLHWTKPVYRLHAEPDYNLFFGPMDGGCYCAWCKAKFPPSRGDGGFDGTDNA